MPAVSQRLARLRAAMLAHDLSAYVIVSADPHLSEYLPVRWQGRKWLTGFTGSVGTVVVTAKQAFLWADSRYWEQAESELAGTGVALMRAGKPDVPEPGDWLASVLKAHDKVGIDGQVLGIASGRKLEEPLTASGLLLQTDIDLLDEVWADRPGLPTEPVFVHDPAFAPTSRVAKLAQLREDIAAHGAQTHIISSLDDIAWLSNLRGQDVDYNPVFLAYAVVTPDTAQLFVPPGKISSDIQKQLATDGFSVADYGTFATALGKLAQDVVVLIDPARTTRGVLAALNPAVRQVEAINPTTLRKTCKTEAELVHVRQTMAIDGAALCEFFAWFDANQHMPGLTELTIDEQLSARRRAKPGFVCLSFPTIAGFNANGAMPHYRATPEAHSAITGDGLLLVDSGGQYVGGTTDITRVVAVGSPSTEQKRDFTLVLKGMINLSRACFPVGLPSPLLDVLARAPIWAGGAEYGHGTGHGVGYFLNVHEGPQVISYRANPGPHTAMLPGMITSNEPGIYRAGQWGVRIENLVANVPGQKTALGEFLRFETLTLCPIDTRCILVDLMENSELQWLNSYHAHVLERVAPLVQGDALAWLQSRCQPIGHADVAHPR